MKRRPWPLILIAILHIFSPLGNLLFNSLWANVPIRIYIQYALKPEMISDQWVQWLAPVLAGVSIYLCKKWSFLLYLICMSALVASSYLGYTAHATPIILFELFAVLAINIATVAYFLLPAVREVYTNPRLRWWESEDRFEFSQEVEFFQDLMKFSGRVRNISNSGLFILADECPPDASMISISFNYEGRNYTLMGNTIRHDMQKATGFGVRFQLNPEMTKSLKQLTKRLREQGKLLQERQPTQEDSFLAWASRLLKTGQGIVPQQRRK